MNVPTLAYVYNAHSFETLALVEAMSNLCRVVWIVDSSDDEVSSMVRLLSRFGEIVDVATLSVESAAEAIAQREPHGILSLADADLLWTAEVAERLQLPFNTPVTVRRLTDKHEQREALAAAGLIVPRHWLLSGGDVNAWPDLDPQKQFMGVFKPRRGEASRDTLPVQSRAELRRLMERYCSGDAPVREFVFEEYIADSAGPVAGEGFAGYVSVESFVREGHVTHLAVNGRMPPAWPFRETGFFIPSALDVGQQTRVLDVAERAARALGVTVGCLHTEIKITPQGPVVIEVNGRIGGGVPEMLRAAAGVDFLKLAVRLALGENVDQPPMPRCERVAYLFYVQAPEEMETVTAVSGLDNLRAVPGVDTIVLNRGPGQRVDWREGNHGYVFSVFGTAESHDELRHVMDLVASVVHIEGR